jgi:hypothetical protein
MSKEAHVAHGIHALLADLPPIREKKNPLVAGVLGFLFGGIGLGLYFGSWKDFLYPILTLLGLAIVLPGIGIVVGVLLTTIWGIVRAANSG